MMDDGWGKEQGLRGRDGDREEGEWERGMVSRGRMACE